MQNRTNARKIGRPKGWLGLPGLLLVGTGIFMMMLAGCGRSDRERMIGVWSMTTIADGRSGGDGKEYFEFREDGTAESRSAPQSYEGGTFEVHEANQTMELTAPDGSVSLFDYEFQGEALLLKTIVKGKHHLNLHLVPTDKKPITPEEEMGRSRDGKLIAK